MTASFVFNYLLIKINSIKWGFIMGNINELVNQSDKKSDLEILEEIHKRLSTNNAKTALVVDQLNKETKGIYNENLRNR
jgi:hypothetical protein